MTVPPRPPASADDERTVRALLAKAERARRRRRARELLARSATVLGFLAAALALGVLLGVLPTRGVLAILLAATALAAALVTAAGLRRDSPAETARWLDGTHHELDLFTTAAEILDPRPDRLPSHDPTWQALVLRRAARRSEEIVPETLLEPLSDSLRRLAGVGVGLAAAAWLVVTLVGPPRREVPVELVELPAAQSSDGAVAGAEAGVLADDAEPIDAEELAALAEGELASTPDAERAGAAGEPGEETGQGDASGEASPEGADSVASQEEADPLLDEMRRDLEPETGPTPEESAPPQDEASNDTPPASQEAARTEQQGDAETEGREAESRSGEDSRGERRDDARAGAPSDATQAGAAETPSDTPSQEEGSPSSDGTGPQAGQAELFGAEAATPLEAAIELEAERLDQLARQFEARENEEREMPSRAQEAETPYRDVRVPTAVGSESWTPSAQVPWKRRAEVRRYFRPDDETDESRSEGEPP